MRVLQEQMNIIERAKQFKVGAETILDWLGSGAKTVSPELAQKRTDICLKCPMNVRESRITEAVAAAIKKQVEIKNRLNLRVKGEKSLLSCSACGCVTRLKVWVPLQNILPEPAEQSRFHEDCWLRHESNE